MFVYFAHYALLVTITVTGEYNDVFCFTRCSHAATRITLDVCAIAKNAQGILVIFFLKWHVQVAEKYANLNLMIYKKTHSSGNSQIYTGDVFLKKVIVLTIL